MSMLFLLSRSPIFPHVLLANPAHPLNPGPNGTSSGKPSLAGLLSSFQGVPQTYGFALQFYILSAGFQKPQT